MSGLITYRARSPPWRGKTGLRAADECSWYRPDHSSAMVAAIGTGEVFSKGRDFAAWLGLVPKQLSTGDPHHPRQDIEER